MTSHHDAPNSRAKGFIFIEFSGNSPPTKSHGEPANHTVKSHKKPVESHTAAAENPLDLISSNSLMLDLVTESS